MRPLLACPFIALIGCSMIFASSVFASAPSYQDQDFQEGDVRQIRIPGTGTAIELVFIPSGSFQMGTAEEKAGDSDEKPERNVGVSAFWMGRFEVSGTEWGIFRFADRDADSSAVNGRYLADAVTRPSTPYEDPSFGMGTDQTPATGMTQWAALQYARWLTVKTGVFFRLPTEAEWEFACGDLTTRLGFDSSRYAWHAGNSDNTLQPVGQLEPNSRGLYDMLGNASEWTLDEYRPEAYAEMENGAKDPWVRPDRRHPRTVRGGSFEDDADSLRCSDRQESTLQWKRRDPQIPKSQWWNTDSPFLGFRLVAPAHQPTSQEQEAFWKLVLGE